MGEVSLVGAAVVQVGPLPPAAPRPRPVHVVVHVVSVGFALRHVVVVVVGVVVGLRAHLQGNRTQRLCASCSPSSPRAYSQRSLPFSSLFQVFTHEIDLTTAMLTACISKLQPTEIYERKKTYLQSTNNFTLICVCIHSVCIHSDN